MAAAKLYLPNYQQLVRLKRQVGFFSALAGSWPASEILETNLCKSENENYTKTVSITWKLCYLRKPMLIDCSRLLQLFK